MWNIRKLLVIALVIFPLLAGLSGAAAVTLTSNQVSNTVIDIGQYVTFNAFGIAGGSGSYTANWIWSSFNVLTPRNTIPATLAGTTAPLTITASSTTNIIITFNGISYPANAVANTVFGLWVFTINVIDAGAANTLSSSNTVKINPALTSGTALTQSNTVLDTGQAVTLTSNPAGGSSPYVINWFRQAACAGTSIGTGSSFSESPLASNTYTYNVVDSATTNSVVCSASNTVTVHSPALTSGTAVTQSNTVLDTGQTVTLTSHPAGGSSPYVINWFRSGSCTGTSIGTGTTFSESPLASNTYTYNVVDSATTNSVVCSASNTVTVHSPALTSGTAVTQSNTVLDTGQTVTLTSHPAGGSSPYVINWFRSGSCTGTSIGTGTTFSESPLASNTYTYNVVDSATTNSVVCSASNTVTVHSPALTSGTALTQSNTVLDTGQTVTLTSNPAGGSSPYVINWFRQAACAGTSIGTGSSFSESPSASNTYTYNVVDSATTNSVVCSASNTVTVHSPALTSGTALTQSNTVLDTGQTVTLTSNPAGGSSPYVINWFRQAACAGTSIGTGSSFSESPSASNTYTYNVVDSATTNSVVCSASNTVTVHSPALTSGTALTQSNTVLDTGQTVTLTSNPAGGSSPYVINWFRQAACAGTSIGTGSSFSESPSASNTYTYNVVDSATTNSVVCSASNTVVAFSAPTITLSVQSANGVVTNTIALAGRLVVNAVVSGGSGTGNFLYSWKLNGATAVNTAFDGTLMSSNALTLPNAGTYIYNVIAIDNGLTTPYVMAQISNTVLVGGGSVIVLTYSYSNPGTAGYFTNPTLTFTGLQTASNQLQWNLYLNGNLYGTTNSAISWTGGYESPGTYSFVFNNIGNVNYTANSLSTTLVIANLQPSGGGLPTTTTQTTVSTTIPATTTVSAAPKILLNSTTYGNIGTTPIVISVPNSSITVSLSSSGPASATLTVSNVTASLGSGVAGTAPIIILNISTVSSANVTTTLTVGYPCSTSPSRITPYKKVPGDGWIAIRNFTVDSAACTMTFSVPPDPIVGLFSANPTTSTTTAPTTTVATTAQTTAASTTVQSQSPPVQNSNTALIALVVIVVIVVIAGAALLSRKKRRR